MKVSSFKPGWRMTVLVLIMTPGLFSLGLWQLSRAEYKRGLETAQYAQEDNLPVSGAELLRQIKPDFVRVALVGHYVAGEHYLLDNQVKRGEPGYRVVQPFRSDDGNTFLIDRGWLPQGRSRDRLPDIPAVVRETKNASQQKSNKTLQRIRIQAIVWPDLGSIPELEQDPWSTTWPKRIQHLALHRMSAQVGASLPKILKLEFGQPGTLEVDTLSFNFNPQRHTGYAYQWFSMSAVLLVAYVIFGFRNTQQTGQNGDGAYRKE